MTYLLDIARFVSLRHMFLMIFIMFEASTLVPLSRADGISFQLSSKTLSATAGGTVTFDGTITNSSGTDLSAIDLFFNFSAYDPSSVNPVQDLGVSTDFLIPNGTTSNSVDLFDVAVGSFLSGTNFPIEVLLQDINGDLSAIETVMISIGNGSGGGTPTPEPASLLLLGIGLATLARKRNRLTSSK